MFATSLRIVFRRSKPNFLSSVTVADPAGGGGGGGGGGHVSPPPPPNNQTYSRDVARCSNKVQSLHRSYRYTRVWFVDCCESDRECVRPVAIEGALGTESFPSPPAGH